MNLSPFTSESVSEGHPDKVADQISDAVVDEVLAADPHGHVAVETLIGHGLLVLCGELTTSAPVDEAGVAALARGVIRDIGYTGGDTGFDPAACTTVVRLSLQAAEIAQGVREGAELGAGDQGLMFGYATDETPELMPLALVLSHRLVARQAALRRSGVVGWLRPDAKSQVTVRYDGETPVDVSAVVLSTQHAAGEPRDAIEAFVREALVDEVVPKELRAPVFRLWVNPTGSFVEGGPAADTGVTGRKIIVDTYGGRCPHGGGAFSGKDPTKVDRSGAYAARWVARNIVAAGLARRCTVQVAYAIGVTEPVSVRVDLHGTGRVDERRLEGLVPEIFPLTPGGILAALDLRRPIYRATAAYGHFGRAGFPWEREDKVGELRRAFGLAGGAS